MIVFLGSSVSPSCPYGSPASDGRLTGGVLFFELEFMFFEFVKPGLFLGGLFGYKDDWLSRLGLLEALHQFEPLVEDAVVLPVAGFWLGRYKRQTTTR